MKIAIHPHPDSFSDKWIEYCKNNQVNYKLVNCYDSDIIQQLEDCDGLMWHWSHSDHKAALFARQLIYSLERMGKKVFPNSNTCWHFDDKLGQKYLLEAIGAPIVPTYVFYERTEAMQWAENTNYPKVFKLRSGAGSSNVSLVENKEKAFELIDTAFGKGFSPVPDIHSDLKTKLRKIKSVSIFWKKALNMSKLIEKKQIRKSFFSSEKGYAYFQNFIPNNDHDIRIVIIGEKAFAIKRMVRENDFRASGSGLIIHDQAHIPIDCVKSAFSLANKLNTQSVAVDYVFSENKIMLIEISYGFARKVYLNCPGYWDKELNWHEGAFTPEWFMISDFIKSISSH